VLLWTAIPESQLQLDNQVRTVQATNNLADVMIYLDFSQPVLNSSHQLQSVLQPSIGNLIATNQSSLGNRRFGFMVKIYFLFYFVCLAKYAYGFVRKHKKRC
jgi:hypothetical protein